MNRVFVIRVGADTTYSPIKSSPLFDNGEFEFLPIWESSRQQRSPITQRPPMLRYCDIPCFNNPTQTLDRFVPKTWAEKPAHNDPEFITMTYGDLCEKSARARNLIDSPKMERTGAKKGDYLFFIARLEPHNGVRFTGEAGLYFIGYFCVERVWGPIQEPLDRSDDCQIGANAHVLRAKGYPNLWSDEHSKFWVFKGGADSIRFRYALEVEWEWMSSVLRDAKGRFWSKRSTQTTLQRMTSYTRTIRCQLDRDYVEQRDRYERFWERVIEHIAREH